MATASKSIVAKTQGVVKCIRKNATTTKQTHTFSSPKIDWITIRTDGDGATKVNFDSDDMSSNFFTLKAGDPAVGPIGITKDAQLHYEKISGTGGQKLEIIAWG